MADLHSNEYYPRSEIQIDRKGIVSVQFSRQNEAGFQDPEIQKTFEEQGYVTVQFYTPEEIEELNKLYDDLHPVDEKGFYPSTFSQDKNYRQKADEEIRRIGSRTISNVLQDQKVVCGSFIVKYPGPDSEMCVHREHDLVDETEFTGINIWCPLVDRPKLMEPFTRCRKAIGCIRLTAEQPSLTSIRM